MPLDDPNAPNDPQEPESPEPQPAPEPQAPPVDLETAYQVIAQHEGWDPRLTKYEVQEQRRRKEELDRRERELQARESRRYQPEEVDNSDPYMRRISNLERIILEDREEQRRQREDAERTNRVASELNSAYTAFARQSGMTREQMEARSPEFYDVLADLYPDPEMVQRIGADRAVRAAFRLFASQNGHRQTNPLVNGRGPTATRFIPGSPQPFVPHGNPLPPEENLSAEQLPGETDEQYEARLRRIIEGVGLRRLPDGTKVQSR